MKGRALRNLMSLAAGIVVFSGCASQQSVTQLPEGPPPPRMQTMPPPPNRQFVWTQGYWDWRGRWVWVPGHWGPRPRPGSTWVGGRWVRHGRRNVWVHSHWQ